MAGQLSPRQLEVSPLICGKEEKQSTLEPSRAEDDQVGLCSIAQNKGEKKNMGTLAQR